jgi:hypothetical protein
VADQSQGWEKGDCGPDGPVRTSGLEKGHNCNAGGHIKVLLCRHRRIKTWSLFRLRRKKCFVGNCKSWKVLPQQDRRSEE